MIELSITFRLASRLRVHLDNPEHLPSTLALSNLIGALIMMFYHIFRYLFLAIIIHFFVNMILVI